MDILLTDIRLASPQPVKAQIPSSDLPLPFAELLRDQPQNDVGTLAEDHPASQDFIGILGNKTNEIRGLENFRKPGEAVSEAPGAVTAAATQRPLPAREIPLPNIPVGVADAVRQATLPTTGSPMPAIPVSLPDASLVDQNLPLGGSSLPREAALPLSTDLPAAAEDRKISPRTATQNINTPDLPQPVTSSALSNADAKPLELPVVSPRSDGPPVSAPVPVQPAPTPPLEVISNMRVDGDPRSPRQIPPGPVAAPDAELAAASDGKGLKDQGGVVESRRLPPVNAPAIDVDAGDDRIALRLPDEIVVRPPPGTRMVPPPPVATNTSSAPVTSPATELPPAAPSVSTPTPESWLRTPLDQPSAVRPDARPFDAGLPTFESAGDAPLPPRESLMQRPAEGLQTNAVQLSGPSMAAPISTAAPLTAGSPYQLALPPQLDTLSLARDAAATEWGEGLGERVSWLVNHKQNSASIRLDPPVLGRLDVQIRVADDATSISIQVQQGQTRDLIDAATPRLREFLQEAGFQNVNVDVSHRQDQQLAHGRSPAAGPAMTGHDAPADESGDAESSETMSAYRGTGLVDTFA